MNSRLSDADRRIAEALEQAKLAQQEAGKWGAHSVQGSLVHIISHLESARKALRSATASMRRDG